MNASNISPVNNTAVFPIPERDPLDRLLGHFEKIADNSSNFLSKTLGGFESHGKTYCLPRYIFLGPKGGGDTIRLGLFALINGDEPEGAFALLRLVAWLEQFQTMAKDYALFLYPVCNPTGFEHNTRHARNGVDLNRAFWTNSPAPEIRYLESEIWTHAFDGIITLHSDKATGGVYGFVNGEVLSLNLLQPALAEAGRFLPRNQAPVIDGSAADNGIIYRHRDGALRAVPGLDRPPFELALVTPRNAPLDRQVEALTAALKSILTHYRTLISTAQNI